MEFEQTCVFKAPALFPRNREQSSQAPAQDTLNLTVNIVWIMAPVITYLAFEARN